MAISPLPGSEHRVPKDERTASAPRASRTVETVQPAVDQETLARVRQEELDAQWRDAGRFE